MIRMPGSPTLAVMSFSLVLCAAVAPARAQESGGPSAPARVQESGSPSSPGETTLLGFHIPRPNRASSLNVRGVAIGGREEWEPVRLQLSWTVSSPGASAPPALTCKGSISIGPRELTLEAPQAVMPQYSPANPPPKVSSSVPFQQLAAKLSGADLGAKGGNLSLTQDSKPLGQSGPQPYLWGSAQVADSEWRVYLPLPSPPMLPMLRPAAKPAR